MINQTYHAQVTESANMHKLLKLRMLVKLLRLRMLVTIISSAVAVFNVQTDVLFCEA